jgi:hypothetical protein
VPFELPQYMQNNSYAARLDRLLIQYIFRGKERVLEGLVVSQKAGTQDSSVDVTAGAAVIQGDDITRHGMYLVSSDSATFTAGKENLVLPAKPVSLNRYDVVGVRTRDAQTLGAGANNDAILDFVSGATSSGTPPLGPALPTIPADFLALAKVFRTSTETAVLTAAITDIGVRGYYPYGSGTAAPTGIGAPGDLYIQYT